MDPTLLAHAAGRPGRAPPARLALACSLLLSAAAGAGGKAVAERPVTAADAAAVIAKLAPAGVAPAPKTVTLTANGRAETLTYFEVDGAAVLGGDMVLDPVLARQAALAALPKAFKVSGPITLAEPPGGDVGSRQFALQYRSDWMSFWPYLLVPYDVDSSASGHEQVISDAISHWESLTEFRFSRLGDADSRKGLPYVLFKGGAEVGLGDHNLGQSDIGMWSPCFADGGCPTRVWLGGKAKEATVRHEIGHALGLLHEHQRRDRDDYLEIHWDNLDDDFKSKRSNLDTIPSAQAKIAGDYDYASLMHYSSAFMAKTDSAAIAAAVIAALLTGGLSGGFSAADLVHRGWCQPLMTRKDGENGGIIDENEGLSAGDLANIDKIYSRSCQEVKEGFSGYGASAGDWAKWNLQRCKRGSFSYQSDYHSSIDLVVTPDASKVRKSLDALVEQGQRAEAVLDSSDLVVQISATDYRGVVWRYSSSPMKTAPGSFVVHASRLPPGEVKIAFTNRFDDPQGLDLKVSMSATPLVLEADKYDALGQGQVMRRAVRLPAGSGGLFSVVAASLTGLTLHSLPVPYSTVPYYPIGLAVYTADKDWLEVQIPSDPLRKLCSGGAGKPQTLAEAMRDPETGRLMRRQDLQFAAENHALVGWVDVALAQAEWLNWKLVLVDAAGKELQTLWRKKTDPLLSARILCPHALFQDGVMRLRVEAADLRADRYDLSLSFVATRYVIDTEGLAQKTRAARRLFYRSPLPTTAVVDPITLIGDPALLTDPAAFLTDPARLGDPAALLERAQQVDGEALLTGVRSH